MNNQKKVLWWLLAIVIVLTTVFLTLKSGWHFIKKDLAKQPQRKSVIKPLLQDELKRMITTASDSLYNLQFSSFVLNIDSGIGLIKDIRLTADSNVYKRLEAQHKAPNMMMNMNADSVFINHFELKKTNGGKQLVVDNVLIQNPDFRIDYYPQPYNDTTRDPSQSLLLKAAKKLMQLMVVKQMKINHLNVEMLNHTNTSTKKTRMQNIDVVMNGLNVKKEHENDTSEQANTIITVANYEVTTADKLYKILMNNMQINPEQNAISVEKTTVQPAYNKAAFFQHVSKANARFYFVYDNMHVQGIDFNKLLHQQQIQINKLTVERSVTDVYTDYELRKRKPPVRKHGFPHELLQQLAFDITIDTMLMHNGVMKYEIKARKSDSTALFEMDDIESEITNITNNSNAKRKNHYTTAISTGKVMNAANIRSVFKFNLNDRNGAFTLQTTMGAMDGKALNPLAKPLAMMEIQSLDIQKIVTTLHANEKEANGNTDLYYKNMKISLLKKKHEGFKKRKFLSWVSNMVMADDNPKKNGKFKKGPIAIQRNPTDSFFKYLWRATFAGMATHMMGVEKTR